jgi:hypothetical protein
MEVIQRAPGRNLSPAEAIGTYILVQQHVSPSGLGARQPYL